TDLRKRIAENKVKIGAQETKKKLLNKELAKVILSKNSSESMKEDFEKYCRLTGTELEIVDLDNEELGTLCKRQHTVSVLGVLK
ncbi:MAG TPA: 50S ribosomal protein L30, partial [Candidatus Woesearchaeota archaeon]|nr:50S ribosomal protein L30 [Candidatus Woesearchaeota archaeon]